MGRTKELTEEEQEKINAIVDKMIGLIDDADMMESIVDIVYDLTGVMTNTQRAKLAEMF